MTCSFVIIPRETVPSKDHHIVMGGLFMKKNRMIIAIAIGICVILAECITAFFSIDHKAYTESLYYISQFVNCAVVACGVIYAAWQYYQSLRDSERNADIVRVQKAIDLAQFYKDNILAKYPPIRYVFDESKICDIFSAIPSSSMHSFDTTELNQFLKESDIKKLQNIQSSDKFIKSLINANVIYDMKLNIDKEIQSIKNNGDNTQTITFTVNKEPVVIAFFRNYIDEALNNMEFFAMHFSHNAADSSVIYQSLHQSYIEIVEALYYFIASQNNDSANKLYTNVIDLYRKWKQEQDNANQQRINLEHELQNRGTVVK